MQFSEQVIQIIDKLCEKFGIVLDWSSANAIPYIQELSNRLIKYEVFTSLIWVILAILMISASYLFLIKSTKRYKNNNKYDTFSEELFIFSLILFVFCSIFGIAIILNQSFDIVQALTIPEKTIIDYLSPYIK
ncbi:hypothetical protein FC831_10630 [Clostridium botulinum]|nr:hypothetical protein [Clostridium botulinum]